MILLNGLPSPLTYSITVDAADNRVRSFHRTTAEDTFLGDVPSAAAAVRRDRAAKLLTDTLELKLEYVREAGGTSAVIRYLPVDTDTFYVDAATGALLNLTELEDQMGGWGAGGSADNTAAAESGGSGLSPAEQAGIAQMEGVRSSAFLDQSLRAEPVYGLTEYALSFRRLPSGGTGGEGGSGPLRPVLCAARRGGQLFPHHHSGCPHRRGPGGVLLRTRNGGGGDTGPDPGGGAGQSGDVPVRPLRRAVECPDTL